MRFEPIFDRVLIRRVDSDLKKKFTKAGLELPDTVDSAYKASQGILLKCGDGCHESVKSLIGQEVLFCGYAGDEIKLNGEEFLLANHKDILGGVYDQ